MGDWGLKNLTTLVNAMAKRQRGHNARRERLRQDGVNADVVQLNQMVTAWEQTRIKAGKCRSAS
jgi:hypothetical protein